MTIEEHHFRFDATTHPVVSERLAAWRDAFSASVDVDVAPEEIADFSAGADFYPLGPALLVDTRYTTHTVVRNRQTIARTGGEQVILDVFTAGAIVGTAGRQPCRATAGDCFFMDMRGTFRLRLHSGRFIGFIMPRKLFESGAAGFAGLHGLVIPAGSPPAELLGALLTSLAARARHLSPEQAEAIGLATISMVAACVLGKAAGGTRREPMRDNPSLVRLRRHIERHAADPAYNPDTLAHAFNLSRATLYRIFRPHGGVADAIRLRRATLAMKALSGAGGTQLDFADVAQACGWSDARAMKRALRAIFDATPEELRTRKGNVDLGPGDAGIKIGALFDDLP